MGKPNIKGVIAVFLAGTAALVGGQRYLDRKAPELRPPQMRDVNNDGIEDKIVQKRAEKELMIGGLRPAFNIDEVFYGVNVNGQLIYVGENVYNKLMKQRQKNQ